MFSPSLMFDSSVNLVGRMPNESYSISLNTTWMFSPAPLISVPIVLLQGLFVSPFQLWEKRDVKEMKKNIIINFILQKVGCVICGLLMANTQI
jgi:hypothetical protein